MKKYLLSIFMILMVVLSVSAQQTDTTYWKKAGVAGINMSQVSLSNWSAGGDGSIAFDANFTYSFDYNRDKQMWTNRLELAYGLNNTETNGTRKTNDKIYLASTYGYKIAKNWYASAFVNFQTQFAKGYNYSVSDEVPISKFMAPGYLSAGLGFTWTPKTWFKATFSPVTWRGTFILDDALSDIGAFGVDPGKKFMNEFGANIMAEAKFKLMENIGIYSRLDLFSNYLEKPQNIDIKWDIQVNMKVNKWISANLTLNMIYDDDTKTVKDDGTLGGAKLQFKEVLGVGLQVTF